jgi:hypothetical protein
MKATLNVAEYLNKTVNKILWLYGHVNIVVVWACKYYGCMGM